ncbi:hypothetical protein MtrunA17_Chr6g0488491 [Medicago truncatula]|uniref:F-box protein n=1 Tax=Medicago truncatula TaxID=3880 RepID=G7KJU2_MEDTR|nr:F-box protein SKIP23 [Medicago truncatula]XP_024641418.1 F-box protein SKIP23 [Medicago truncatula]AES77147.2 F-box protein [Medicago truncatula]RHN53165.1 hypothetical protein MtrunA17_Chr6g0488491 [Medicago truncatula]
MMDDDAVDWLNLPRELWLVIISKNLNPFDVLRFRSVCALLRSILPPPFPSPSHTLRIPDGKFLLFTETKIFRLQPLFPTSSSNKGWIIKVEKSKSGKLRHLDVVTNTHMSHTFPSNVLDFMNLRVMELFQAYTINFSRDGGDLIAFEPLSDVYKVVLFSVEGPGQMVFALHQDGKLRVSNIGYNNLIIVDDGNRIYNDIILYMGKVYVVDKSGIIFWINCSSFKLVQCSPSLSNDRSKKCLVDSHGSLFVVEMYSRRTGVNTCKLLMDISVLNVDGESSRWLRVTDLGDNLFVLGKDLNFSLSANDYYGFERNCIYFCCIGRTARYNLNSSGFKYVDDIFWPCSTLFNSESVSDPLNIECAADHEP